VDSEEVAFAGVVRQAELIRAGEISSRELLDVHLDRIERLDPQLNAFRVVLGERARTEADQADARRGAGDERPLLGVPIAIKDNVDVAGEVSTHGSDAYGEPAAADAELVRRLRAAGAVILGKTHLPELAIFPWTESETWGSTQNPWKRGRSPGGSSGGSACAVAAGLAPAASASDGGGSIRVPAACTGLFGLKPQRGRVPLSPLPEHWHGLSVAGVLTRTVLDTAVLLDVLSGAATGDAGAPPPPSDSFAAAARRKPERLRIALSSKPSTLAPVDRRVRAGVEQLAEVLRGLGHEVSERDPDYGFIEPLFLPRWLRGIRDDVREVAHPERLEHRTHMLARAGALIPDAAVARARRAEAGRARRINAVFDEFDVLLTPVLPVPVPRIGRLSGRSTAVTTMGASRIVPFMVPWNLIGQPAASLPAAVDDDGLPIAAQLVGRPNDEQTLLSLAAELEGELRWPERRPVL
jgi:amidase